uniref:P2X purinoceptor n=1 Tax=Cyprinus carpio TaxID=7962 RepID=A0A8C2L900_CYPCA
MKPQIKIILSNFFFEYETPRQVLVRNKKVAVACRIIQMGVLAYIIGWVFMYEKGYHAIDTAIGSVFTKMKGVSLTNISGEERIWDAADFVFPEQVVCSDQHQSFYTLLFPYGIMSLSGQMTGRCISNTSTCEIYSWCPVEDDRQIPDPAILLTSENYTLFIKNSITFPHFNVVRSNLVESVNQSYINTCLYHPKTDPLCPIFRLRDIVELSGFSFSEIARLGGAIGLLIDWDCNLDLSIRHCEPKYEFYGLYGTGRNDKEEKPSLGYNFRYAKYYVEKGVEKRTLMKVFGVRIDIIVNGRAGKFDIIPTLTAIGSGVGIFGVATVVCDLLLLHFVTKKDFYKNMKFKHTEIPEEVSVFLFCF